MKPLIATISFSLLPLLMSAQSFVNTKKSLVKTNTVLAVEKRDTTIEKERFPVIGMIAPATMITYGLLSLNSNGLKKFNEDFQRKIWVNSPHKKTVIDNILVLTPTVGAFALEAFGVKSKNNLRDKTMIYLMSGIIANGTAFSLKRITQSIRPDGSNSFSFPSGHVTQAFASAEFIRKEYKNVSIWYGIAGYTIAATVGYLRLYNNKHWFSDVVAGAGIGIASTKLAYWLYPKIQHWFFKSKAANTAVMPTYNDGSFGFGIIHHF